MSSADVQCVEFRLCDIDECLPALNPCAKTMKEVLFKIQLCKELLEFHGHWCCLDLVQEDLYHVIV